MTPKQLTNSLLRTVGILTLVCFLLYFLWLIRAIFAYCAIAFVIAMIGRPLVNFLNKRLLVPNTIAAILTLLLFMFLSMGSFAGFIALVLKEPLNFINNFKSIDDFDVAIHEQLVFLNLSLEQLNLPIVKDYLDTLMDDWSKVSLAGYLNESISTITSLIIDTFAVTFIAFFFMKDKEIINNFILMIVPDRHEEKFLHALETSRKLMSRYFIGLICQVTIMFIFYLIILLSFGINYAAMIALICAMLNLLPYLGPFIGGFLMAMLVMGDMNSYGYDMKTRIIPDTLWIVGLYIITQVFDNIVNQPLIYSRSVKSGPLEIFIVILIGGILFGVIGVIVAVPAYTVIRVLSKEFFSNYKIVQGVTKNL